MCIAAVALAVAAIGPGRLAADCFFRWGTGGWAELPAPRAWEVPPL
ncbi:hypothetical protein [Streptomyces sp. NPDC056817]